MRLLSQLGPTISPPDFFRTRCLDSFYNNSYFQLSSPIISLSISLERRYCSSSIPVLHKTSDPQIPSDFRVISIVHYPKSLEKVVHEQLLVFIENNILVLSLFQSGFRAHHSTTSTLLIYELLLFFIENNNLLSPFQSGFRALHSTTALLKVTDNTRRAVDNKQLILLTLFGFSKAFDCVYHPLIFLKLRIAGFSDGRVDWVKYYLSERRQCVRDGEMGSDWRSDTLGVSASGSVLGPLLFLLYSDNIKFVKMTLPLFVYADYLQTYIHVTVTDFNGCVLVTNGGAKAISRRHEGSLDENKTGDCY